MNFGIMLILLFSLQSFFLDLSLNFAIHVSFL